jgi:hypothetical protein
MYVHMTYYHILFSTLRAPVCVVKLGSWVTHIYVHIGWRWDRLPDGHLHFPKYAKCPIPQILLAG